MRFPEYGREPRLVIPQSCGGHSEGETPGPIPNPEVKPLSADGTAREASRESRTPPRISSKEAGPQGPASLRCAPPPPPPIGQVRFRPGRLRHAGHRRGGATDPRRDLADSGVLP